MKCECPEVGNAYEDDRPLYVEEEYKAMSHLPNECPGDYGMEKWNRDGQILWLCSCCCLPGDTFVKEEETVFETLHNHFPWINANDGSVDEGFFDA